RRTVRGLLEQLREEKIAVLLNSHLLSEIELVCDRVTIISHGEVVAAGAPAELSRPRGVEIETEDGVVSHPHATREETPALVEALARDGKGGYGRGGVANTL